MNRNAIIIVTAISIALLSLWPIGVYYWRWWNKPYQKPKRLLRNLQYSLGLSRSDRKHLSSLLGNQSDPYQACQYLLDPSRWPIDQSSERTMQLYAKVFRER
ncbi:MAG: hypothetical protein SGI77_07865 [Pirellulaceae bacterium]|nr:hypothetical protein [Pirellulaceae bacterium]